MSDLRICPKCGSTTNTYRHVGAKVWCHKCGFVLREEGGNPGIMNKEEQEIAQAIDVFSTYMTKRMLQKVSEGITGWRQPQDLKIRERLLFKVIRVVGDDTPTDKDLIDIANLAMILFMDRWRMGEKL